MKNVLEYLEYTAARLPDKIALTDGVDGASLTFSTLLDHARRAGSELCRTGVTGKRVAVLMERHPGAVAAMMGVAYAGACCVPLDATMPRERISYILEKSSVAAIVCDKACAALAASFGLPWLDAELLFAAQADDACLAAVRKKQSSEDELYIIFTSGSTGVPKGVVGCHRAVIDYAEALTAALGFGEDCVFGCQSPLYFDAPLKELLTMMKRGATVCLVPRPLFSFPVPLLRYLNDNRVNTICWVSSALSSVAALGGLEAEKPSALRTVVFGSEVFPLPHFRMWREVLPEADFWQLYGPTEATGMSCYFKVDRDFADGERIPIGRPFDGTGLLLIDENGEASDEGEICLYGDCLTLGYDNDEARTAEAFVMLRCEDGVTRRVYRTGDIACRNERGELEFLGRRDGQIKRMGHRIELGEIEAAALRCQGVHAAACVVSGRDEELVLYITGDADEADVERALREYLPRYMQPRRCCRGAALPHTENGKIDRRALAKGDDI